MLVPVSRNTLDRRRPHERRAASPGPDVDDRRAIVGAVLAEEAPGDPTD